MIAPGAIVMEELMERVADREAHRDEEQDRKDPAQCRFRQVASCPKCSSRSHYDTSNEAYALSQRKLVLKPYSNA